MCGLSLDAYGILSLNRASSYSFIVFDCPGNAQRAKDKFDGQLANGKKTPLMEYVHFVPQTFLNRIEHLDTAVDGLAVFENVISVEHEAFLLDILKHLKWDQLKTRKVVNILYCFWFEKELLLRQFMAFLYTK